MWVVFQQFTNRSPQRAGAVAMDDAYFAQTIQERLVEKFVYCVDSFVGRLSDDVRLSMFEFCSTRNPKLCRPSALGGRRSVFYEFEILELLAKAQRFHSDLSLITLHLIDDANRSERKQPHSVAHSGSALRSTPRSA